MIVTRLMLVELVRVVAEMFIHLVLYDYNPEDIHLQTSVHSMAGDTSLLYDTAAELGWKGGNASTLAWVMSNQGGLHSRTVIYREGT